MSIRPNRERKNEIGQKSIRLQRRGEQEEKDTQLEQSALTNVI